MPSDPSSNAPTAMCPYCGVDIGVVHGLTAIHTVERIPTRRVCPGGQQVPGHTDLVSFPVQLHADRGWGE